MLIDANTLPHGHMVESDICIIGAGVAGITIANQLASSGKSITLLESGDLEFSAQTQQLYDGDYLANDVYKLTTSRLRYFGGTSNHWVGNCMRFRPADFMHRDWIPGSGWPIEYAQLEPYYFRAAQLCELQTTEFDATHWANQGVFPLMDPDNTAFRQEVIIQSPPTRFGQRYREPIAQSERITTYLNCNVTNIVPVASGNAIDRVDCSTLHGKPLVVRAKQYVLSCGGIENARLLLASNRLNTTPISVNPDIIGRYFLDHAVVQGGTLVCEKGTRGLEMFLGHKVLQGQYIRGLLRSTPALQQSLGVADCFLVISPGRELTTYAKSYLKHAAKAVSDLDIAMLLKRQLRLVKRIRKHLTDPQPDSDDYDLYNITVRPEQVPNPDSRVSLSDRNDALGIPRAKVEWRLGEFDFLTMQRTLEKFANEMGRLGIGRFRFELGEGPVYPDRMNSGPHHMGTTRMSDNPREGVVDRHCCVHGVDNLYVAGSSVFTTSSSIMPTLTVIALAARLADHLGEIR